MRDNCAMTAPLICHCGREIRRPQQFGFESRLNMLCYACAKARCDESTEVCPYAGDHSDIEQVSSQDERRDRSIAYDRELDEQRALARGSSRQQSNRTD
jgi:hypothetical protein